MDLFAFDFLKGGFRKKSFRDIRRKKTREKERETKNFRVSSEKKIDRAREF